MFVDFLQVYCYILNQPSKGLLCSERDADELIYVGFDTVEGGIVGVGRGRYCIINRCI